MYLDFEHEYNPVNVITDGVECNVEWLGSTLWTSNDDERDFDEVMNDWEPIYPFLVKRIQQKVNSVLKESKLILTRKEL